MAKSKKKPISLDRLARMVQAEFSALHQRFDETASKSELGLFRRDTEAGFLSVAQSLKAIHSEIKDLKGMDAELTSLRLRLARVERKVGLSH